MWPPKNTVSIHLCVLIENCHLFEYNSYIMLLIVAIWYFFIKYVKKNTDFKYSHDYFYNWKTTCHSMKLGLTLLTIIAHPYRFFNFSQKTKHQIHQKKLTEKICIFIVIVLRYIRKCLTFLRFGILLWLLPLGQEFIWIRMVQNKLKYWCVLKNPKWEFCFLF